MLCPKISYNKSVAHSIVEEMYFFLLYIFINVVKAGNQQHIGISFYNQKAEVCRRSQIALLTFLHKWLVRRSAPKRQLVQQLILFGGKKCD